MEYRRLGDAGMKVSVISLGAWINFEAKIDEEEARAIIRTAYDSGITFFDNADVYGRGAAEWWMGKMLGEFPRHTLVLSTKVFGQMSDDPNDRGLSRKHIMESIDKSLRRLNTDYVDIYFCHRPDDDTPLLETMHAMTDLIRAGKVLYWGTSEWEPEQIQQAHELAEEHKLYPPQTEQPQYSMLVRERVEEEFLPVTEPLGVGLVVWSPLAGGMLTGKYDDGIPEDSRFNRESWAKDRYLTDDNVERVKQLREVAEGLGVSRAQLALAWCLRQDGVSSTIIGATKERHITDCVGAANVELEPDTLDHIDTILGE